MTDAHNILEIWKSRIERDLASFGDPGTIVNVTRTGRNFRANWTARGTIREAMFIVSSDESISVRVDGRRLAYSSFVAGPDLADLQTVARMILQASKPELYISTNAKCDDPDSTTATSDLGPAVDVLTELLESDNSAATRVIMLTGSAGAGKTHILRELVRLQAEKYLHGQTTKLLLYVNAQGRALARLNEALATELQDLKVSLTYHSVAVLARLDILIPVIDGFDELLGVSGYDDAFSSLAGLLEQLEGNGQLLASARSVYYEEEFLARADKISTASDQAWRHIPVRVADWSDNNRESYLDRWVREKSLSAEDKANINKRLNEVFSDENHGLSAKPLFFTRMLELLHRNPQFSGSNDLLRELVVDYLSRERNEKLLDRQSDPMLTQRQFERLMCELAEEMWNQDTRELDYRTVREIAEYTVEDEGLSENTKAAIIERIPTLAFLARGSDPVSHTGSFEHELFFFYFLGKAIASRFTSTEGDMRIVLSRSALPEDVADRIAIELGTEEANGQERLQGLLDRLIAAGQTEWLRTTQVRENAGLIVMALFRSYRQMEGYKLCSVIFPGSHLSGVSLIRCSLVDVVVRRSDLSSTQFLDCQAQNVLFLEPLVRPEVTRLELNGLKVEQVTGIHVLGLETNYDPSFVTKTLIECGTSIPTDRDSSPGVCIPHKYIALLQRLMLAFRRTNPVYLDNQKVAAIIKDPDWGTLENLLVAHDLVKKEWRHPSGRPTQVLRRQFLPEKLMVGLNESMPVNKQIRAFWNELKLQNSNAS